MKIEDVNLKDTDSMLDFLLMAAHKSNAYAAYGMCEESKGMQYYCLYSPDIIKALRRLIHQQSYKHPEVINTVDPNCTVSTNIVYDEPNKESDADKFLSGGAGSLGSDDVHKVMQAMTKDAKVETRWDAPSQHTYIAVEIYDDEIRYNGKTIFRGKFHTDEVDGIVNAYKANQTKNSSQKCQHIPRLYPKEHCPQCERDQLSPKT